MKDTIAIKVLREGKVIGRFEFELEGGPKTIALPEASPYNGLAFHLSTDGKGGYEFTPDAAEYWVRFGKTGPFGRLNEYLADLKSYLLLFRAYEGKRDATLDQEIEAIKAKVPSIYDEELVDSENVERLGSLKGIDPKLAEQFKALLIKRNLF